MKMMNQAEVADDAADALKWLRALCEEGRFVPTECVSQSGPPEGFDAARFARGQRVARDNLFSLAYAELVSMLMMFAFEDQTAALLATGQSDTPAKAYFRYLSTMRRVRTWYEGDPWEPTSEAARNIKVVRSMHDQVGRKLAAGLSGPAGPSLHARLGGAELRFEDMDGLESLPPHCPAASATREAFGAFASGNKEGVSAWATLDSARPPALNQRAMAVTQVAFVGLFILEPARFGGHLVSDEDLEALVYVWQVLGRALGIGDRFNACGSDLNNNDGERATTATTMSGLEPTCCSGGTAASDGGLLRLARARCQAVAGACAVPRLARATAGWHLMASALCDGAALAAPGLSLPLALAALVDVLAAVGVGEGGTGSSTEHPAVERLMSLRDRVWRFLYGLVLGKAMRRPSGRALHNALFRLSLWVSLRAQRARQRVT